MFKNDELVSNAARTLVTQYDVNRDLIFNVEEAYMAFRMEGFHADIFLLTLVSKLQKSESPDIKVSHLERDCRRFSDEVSVALNTVANKAHIANLIQAVSNLYTVVINHIIDSNLDVFQNAARMVVP